MKSNFHSKAYNRIWKQLKIEEQLHLCAFCMRLHLDGATVSSRVVLSPSRVGAKSCRGKKREVCVSKMCNFENAFALEL